MLRHVATCAINLLCKLTHQLKIYGEKASRITRRYVATLVVHQLPYSTLSNIMAGTITSEAHISNILNGTYCYKSSGVTCKQQQGIFTKLSMLLSIVLIHVAICLCSMATLKIRSYCSREASSGTACTYIRTQGILKISKLML